MPFIAIPDPIMSKLSIHLEAEVHHMSGRQHVMDAEYYSRIEAMQFVLSYDNGQSAHNLDKADTVSYTHLTLPTKRIV